MRRIYRVCPECRHSWLNHPTVGATCLVIKSVDTTYVRCVCKLQLSDMHERLAKFKQFCTTMLNDPKLYGRLLSQETNPTPVISASGLHKFRRCSRAFVRWYKKPQAY